MKTTTQIKEIFRADMVTPTITDKPGEKLEEAPYKLYLSYCRTCQNPTTGAVPRTLSASTN